MGSDHHRPEEDAARAVIQATLGLPVELNDTGKTPSAWDFTIDPHGEPQALEVVRCVDARSRKNGAAAERHTGEGIRIDGLHRRWTVQINDERHPIYGLLAQQLRRPLLAAEAAGLSTVQSRDWSSFHKPQIQPIAAALGQLRVEQAYAVDARTPEDEGLVSLANAFGFSIPPGTEPGLLELENFLHSPAVADVRSKVASSGLARRHAFVWVEMTGAPSSWRLFGHADEYELPVRRPRLPEEITDVWWLSGARGWRWSPEGWSELQPGRPQAPVDDE
jgi:hypothetical protein